MANFIALNDPSVSLSVSSTSSSVQLGTTNGFSVLVDNTGTAPVVCYVKSGLSGVTATTNDLQISAGEKAVYAIDPSHTHVAAITESGTTTLRLVRSGSGGE